MASISANPIQLPAEEFANRLLQNHSISLPAHQSLQITGVDQEACLEPVRAPLNQRLDAIERVFNRILQNHHLRIDDIVTDGAIHYNAFAPGSFSILSTNPLEIRVRPWNVAIAFRSLFDPNRQQRCFQFLPRQKIIFTDLNSRAVTWAGNAGLAFWLSNYLRDQTPEGFAVDIIGNQLAIGTSDNGNGLALTDDAGLQIRVRKTGPTPNIPMPPTQGNPLLAARESEYCDANQFEQVITQEISAVEKPLCTGTLGKWVFGIFSSITSFISTLYSSLCGNSSQ